MIKQIKLEMKARVNQSNNIVKNTEAIAISLTLNLIILYETI